ncbi:MAG: hypothetical protein IKH88_05255, partial [Prevotella sp.]|nr:hypothetical protein [Prevotella sp.]
AAAENVNVTYDANNKGNFNIKANNEMKVNYTEVGVGLAGIGAGLRPYFLHRYSWRESQISNLKSPISNLQSQIFNFQSSFIVFAILSTFMLRALASKMSL